MNLQKKSVRVTFGDSRVEKVNTEFVGIIKGIGNEFTEKKCKGTAILI
jgi:hypothetical protein